MSEYEVIGDAEDIEVEELSQSQKSSQYSYRHSSQSSYSPSDSSQFSSSSEDENPPISAKECVIVEQDQLLQLFNKCRRAGCTAAVDEDDIQINRTGAAIHVVATCNNSHVEHWMSSSTVGEGHSKLFVVNVLLAIFTLLCGLNIGQIVEFFKHMKILCISDEFFNDMQRQILHKIVWMSWCYEQKTVIEEIKEMQRQGKKNAVAGDAKYDLPGYCATFCTYTVQSLLNKKIVSLWVAHKSIVSSSGKMETFCAKTLILNLAWEHELEIHSLTTDRAKDMKALMSHDSMLVRSCLTALDYNSNVTRSQAKTAAGVPRFSLVKQRNAKKYNVRKVKVEKDYSFRDNIASLVLTVW